MSRPAPNPRQNYLQTALIMVIVYLAINLFFRPGQNQQNVNPSGPRLVTRADYLAQLRLDDQQGKEATAQNLFGDYTKLIDADVDKKVISKAEGEAEKVEGATIVANAFLKGGLLTNNSSGIRNGYQVLQSFFRRDQDLPAWRTPVAVYASPTRIENVSPQDLRQNIIDTLSARNKSDKVWGIIPGGYQLIDFLVHLTGARPYFSYAFAAFLLAFVVRAAVFPLSQKQLMFSRQMSQLTPRIAEIKKEFPNDTTEQSRRTMELYKTYGINPAAGCLPALVQMPLFLTVYQCMLLYQFQFSHGYFAWINPVTSLGRPWIAHDLGQQDYILIAIYGVTMTISTLLTPVTDPTQLKQQRLMGVGIAIMITISMYFGVVPVVSGFVLYWTFTNLLATAQSFRAYRMPLPPLVKVNAPNGGVYPSTGPKGIWMKMLEDAQRVTEEGKKASEANGKDASTNGKVIKNGSIDVPMNGKSKEKSTNPDSNAAKDDQPLDKPQDKPKHKPKKRQ